METNNSNTAAVASIDDITECEARADAQVRALLGRVLAQKRSAGVALDYVTALAPGTKANCWALAEAAGHEGWGRMQGLLRSYQWDWKELRAQLPALAAAWIPGPEEDLIGPGIAIDETAQLKHGDGTACVAPQHAGCTGKVENCVTTVFSAYVGCGQGKPGRGHGLILASVSAGGAGTGRRGGRRSLAGLWPLVCSSVCMG